MADDLRFLSEHGLQLAWQLLSAIIAGGLLGYERQRKSKPVGMLTAILVTLGATVIALPGSLLAKNAPGTTDLTRMPSMIVSGIGFIGAGAIIRSNFKVNGLASAATIWVLGGGGILGAMFQIGVLAALEEADPRQAEFDLVVGTSGGSVVGALLVAGIRPAELRQMASSFAPANLAGTCWRGLLRWLVRSPARVLAKLREERRHGGLLFQDLATAAFEAAPSGLLTLDPLIRFLAATLQEHGLEDRFDALPRQLLVPAIDLDWGERLVFGAGNLRSATVSSAVAASCAIPRLFRPVTIDDRDLIDGGISDLLNLDLALRPTITEVLAIHAVVAPLNDGRQRCLPSPTGRCGRIAEQGFGAVTRQASKIGHMLVTNALIDLRGRLRRDVAIRIVQPDRLEVDLDGLMDFRAASRLLEDGERAAERFLASQAPPTVA